MQWLQRISQREHNVRYRHYASSSMYFTVRIVTVRIVTARIVVQSLSPVSRRDRIGCSHARNGLSEYLTGGDQPQCLHVDEITSVGIQKAVAICIGMQIEP